MHKQRYFSRYSSHRIDYIKTNSLLIPQLLLLLVFSILKLIRMAIIKLSGIISEIRGTIGGITYANTGAGLTAKKKVPKRRNPSIKMSKQWGPNALLVQGYRNLTPAQRLEWKNYATTWDDSSQQKVGRRLNAYNWYYSMNYYRIIKGLVLFTVPPAHVLPTPAPALSMSITPTALKITSPNPAMTANRLFIITASLPTSCSNRVMKDKCVRISAETFIGQEGNNYRMPYKQFLGLDPCGFDLSKIFQIMFTCTVYSIDSGLFLPGVNYIFSTDPRPGGIPSMSIGSTFVVQ